MTLAPVFRSAEAVAALTEKGYLEQLEASVIASREAIAQIEGLLPRVIDGRYIGDSNESEEHLLFVQENFFMLMFHSLFRSLPLADERLRAYTQLNYCIKGIVVCGDNLFDDEAKQALPLTLGRGSVFNSIVQMLSLDHLIMEILERDAGFWSNEQKNAFRRTMLSRLTLIGTLEGSEERGVDEIPAVETMINEVHRIRGGELFGLSFIAPEVGETGESRALWEKAAAGIRHIGTAFQIVDDLTDFEFDLGRRSHNIVVAQIHHHGSEEERSKLAEVIADNSYRQRSDLIEQNFMASANAVYSLAVREAEAGFNLLKELNFWIDPADSELFVRAIAGDNGFDRIRNASGL